MDHLGIVEKLCERISDTMENGNALYIYSAAIYDIWSVGSELEKNLIARIVKLWTELFEYNMIEGYKNTRYNESRPQRDDYYKRLIASGKIRYSDHKGLCAALDAVSTDTSKFDGF